MRPAFFPTPMIWISAGSFQQCLRIGGQMPRENFGGCQESLGPGGPGETSCHLPRPSAEVSVRLLSGRAGTDQIMLKPVPTGQCSSSRSKRSIAPACLAAGRSLRSSRYRRELIQNSRKHKLGGTFPRFGNSRNVEMTGGCLQALISISWMRERIG